MDKLLERAIEKVKALPEGRQRYAAEVLEHIAASSDDFYVLTEEEERLIDEGLDDLDAGRIASEAEVRAVFDKYIK